MLFIRLMELDVRHLVFELFVYFRLTVLYGSCLVVRALFVNVSLLLAFWFGVSRIDGSVTVSYVVILRRVSYLVSFSAFSRICGQVLCI